MNKPTLHNYLISTNTEEKWQIIGGEYIVTARDKRHAKKVLVESKELRQDEEICEVYKIETKRPEVFVITGPIIE